MTVTLHDFTPGTLVRARGRDWVVQADSCPYVVRLRALGDANDDVIALVPELELQTIEPATVSLSEDSLSRRPPANRGNTPIEGESPPKVWEGARKFGLEELARTRDGLRHGVTQALLTLGNGFLRHTANEDLRRRLQEGRLDADDYFQHLLRLVYRVLFLFNVEERGMLHVTGDTIEALAARRAYAEGYALRRLRELSLTPRATTSFEDHWHALRIVFKGLARGEPRLALPAFGGLFAETQCSVLDAAALDNAHLLTAMRHLCWTNHKGTLVPVDYGTMEPEELGSVYESLLELVPEIERSIPEFGFVGVASEGSTAGNTRKLTGSYYTPDSLIQELLRSALNPVIERRLATQPTNPIEAILSIRVIDPACGTGHFLLAAARRLAETVVRLRSPDESVKPQVYRHALREVVGRCIFGVDRNPMALELARTALWLEGFEAGRPISFLNHHLRCGDALLGLTEVTAIEKGIPKEAFKAISGDDTEVCKRLVKSNAAGCKRLERDVKGGQILIRCDQLPGLATLQAIEAMPRRDTVDFAAQEARYQRFLRDVNESPLARAADLVVGTFLLSKSADKEGQIPTSELLRRVLTEDSLAGEMDWQARSQLQAARAACVDARVFHWPLAFPQVFASGGFDCVLGNPPWERITLQEEEFFATRNHHVAEARTKAERGKRIGWLRQGVLAANVQGAADNSVAEKRIYAEFLSARRTAEALSVFAHVKEDRGGRYPLTGVGDVNTYALFAETISQIVHSEGRAGFIVPTGIATDDSTKAFFARITQTGRLVSLFDIENREGLFPAVDSRVKFCLVTLGNAEGAEFVCYATQVSQLSDSRRRFRLTPEDLRLINPNTRTCPMFRSERDAELTKKLYRAAPVLIDEGHPEGNAWGISFLRLLDMSIDSGLFSDYPSKGRVPLYEAKLVHHFDHRWATCTEAGQIREVSPEEKCDTSFGVRPRHWVEKTEVEERLNRAGWTRPWLLGCRSICRATDERSLIASVIPRGGVGNSVPLLLCSSRIDPRRCAALVGALSSLVFDFVVRQKIGGTNLNFFYMKQFPMLEPDRFQEEELSFITPRVLELTYTATDLTPWAEDLGYLGSPFPFNLERRAILRAELDAFYARLYRLTRDEVRYILDPAAVMGEGYPSETFRVLKNKEASTFGEYRTQRLVLEAWDRLEHGG